MAFDADYDAFRQAIGGARDLLTQHQATLPVAEREANTEILAALREVEQTVSSLASWTNDRLSTELPADKKRDAAQAAEQLSTLVARRLVTLGATS